MLQLPTAINENPGGWPGYSHKAHRASAHDVAAFFRRNRIALGDLKLPFHPGLTRDLTDVLAVERLNVEAMSTVTTAAPAPLTLGLTMPVNDLDQLARVLHRLSMIPNAIQARRAR